MSTIRYAIIGSGMMGQEHIRNLALIDGTQVSAVADPNSEMRRRAAELAGPGCAAFDHHGALLAAGGFDALVVAAPNHLHRPILDDVLKVDVPLLVEKPLGLDGPQCREIMATANGRRAPVWVAMEYRYMPPIARLLDEVRKGSAGVPRMIAIREHRFPFLSKVGDWNRFQDQTGGTMIEKCCHFFDLMRLVSGSEAVRVYASGGMDVNFRDETFGGRKADILDNAFVIVDFENGMRAMLDLCMFAEGAYWQETVSVTGDKARIDAHVPGPARFSTDGRERHARLVISPRDTKAPVSEDIVTDEAILSAGDHHGSTFYQHERFARIVREGGLPEVSMDDGARAVEIGAAAEESAKTGMPVTL
ncbi:Gfo/Idh/MocA family oxidoreductase [Nitratireductor sp. XY-223]|uniref:Gfo/Idh/MocA family protein n=1 Tax=Nitratireductor sp. XY-223 TaxID=2561926 RepID=UPI0010AA05BA|nr:Gfo/Idh/MocA family oxidoreductase [Nitratireductor sp. XY-223]